MIRSDRSLNVSIKNSTYNLSSVIFGNGVFVAIDKHNIIRSADGGSTWSTVYTAVSTNFYGLHFVNGKFYVQGQRQLQSADGITWNECPIYVNPPYHPPVTVTGNANTYIVTPSPPLTTYDNFSPFSITINTTNTGPSTLNVSGLGSLKIVQSDATSDIPTGTLIAGRTYGISIAYYSPYPTPISVFAQEIITPPPPIDASDIQSTEAVISAFGASVYVAIGQPFDDGSYCILTSTDTKTWVVSNNGLPVVSGALYSVRFLNNKFFAAGDDNTLLTSLDGYTWTKQSSGDLGVSGSALADIVYNAGTYTLFAQDTYIMTITDGNTWTRTDLPSGLSNTTLSAIVVAGTIYASGAGSFFSSSDNGTTWTPIESLTIAGGNGGLAYGAGVFVFVSGTGLRRSTDGVHFTTIFGPITSRPLAFAQIGSVLIATFYVASDGNSGTMGIIRSSDDGASWTGGYNVQYNSPLAMSCDLCASNSLFVIVGDAGTIQTSPDGMTWTTRTSPTSNTLGAVQYVNGRFIAGGSSGTVITSTDGITWTLATTPVAVSGSSMLGAIYTGQRYVAVSEHGEIIISNDALTWTFATTVSSAYIITWNGAVAVVAGNGPTIATSADGITWTTRTASSDIFGSQQLLFLTTSGTRIFAAGGGTLAYSDDNGINWFNVFQGYQSFLQIDLIFKATSRLIAVGATVTDAGIDPPMYSVDNGTTWYHDPVESKNIIWSATDMQVCNSKYFALGSRQVNTSTDAVTWTASAILTLQKMYGVAYKSGVYVIVGSGFFVYRSTDAISWTWIKTKGTNRWQNNSSLFSITANSTIFVAVGQSGNIITSADGQTWTTRSDPTGGCRYVSVEYAFGKFFAVAVNTNTNQSGKLVSSVDGITWSSGNLPGQTTGVAQPNEIKTINGKLFICGSLVDSATFNTSPYIASSTDGTTWSVYPTIGSQSAAKNISYNNGIYAVLDSGGNLLTSADLAIFTVVQNITDFNHIGSLRAVGSGWVHVRLGTDNQFKYLQY